MNNAGSTTISIWWHHSRSLPLLCSNCFRRMRRLAGQHWLRVPDLRLSPSCSCWMGVFGCRVVRSWIAPAADRFAQQDVTDSIQRQRQFQWLLVASAGSSVLLTASLLRLVLWRGLVLPLDQLNSKVTALQADSLGRSLMIRLPTSGTAGMAEAFNGLRGDWHWPAPERSLWMEWSMNCAHRSV